MAVIKCKMCGGDMELTADKTFGTCEYCGSTMTLPKVDDEQRAAAFNRGNHFRRIGEFDKALAVYERIIRDNETDAEAHWCCALCRFGIEYVEDPTTYEWLPTCHRASFDSFLEDVDYKAALEYSDGITRRQYLKDGAKIAEVQRGILATSQNTEPYDVFICYKESDENGERTRDSLMAQEIYYQLTEQGRRVFFARITLEDVAGTQYEPYIFAALNSAKVMVVVGTKPEYLNAVWVKNEWSRFLAMMKKDRHKILLPCYRDMDPYDMPDQLSVLQSYDMAKIGFIQDLTRGIAKVLNAEKKPETVKETVVVQQPSAPTNTAPLLKRAFMFLEDGEWDNADEYCEKVLDMEPENALAYLGKLMAELCVSKVEELRDEQEPFDDENNYQKVMRFADDTLKNTLEGYIEHINIRNENVRVLGIYNKAKNTMQSARTEYGFKDAASLFESILDYEDSANLAQECYAQAETARKDAILSNAKTKMFGEAAFKYEDAISLLESIPGWKDADESIAACRQKIAEIKAREAAEQQEKEHQQLLAEQKRKKEKKRINTIAVATVVLSIIAVVVFVLVTEVIIPGNAYKKAETLFADGQYEEAIVAFESLGNFKDAELQANVVREHKLAAEKKAEMERLAAEKKAEEERLAAEKKAEEERLAKEYVIAEELVQNGETAKAAIAFGKLGNYQDARERSMELWNSMDHLQSINVGESGHMVGLVSDGTVNAAGKTDNGRCLVGGWENIVSVSAGAGYTIGLKSDGTVLATGFDDNGRCEVENWQDIISINTGIYHTIGIKTDGTVVATGTIDVSSSTKPNKRTPLVSNWKDIVQVCAGKTFTLGLKSDGTVVSDGANNFGQCDVTDWKNIVSIDAGEGHSVGVKANGTVVATGYDYYGQCDVKKWKDIISIKAGGLHTVGLKSDGTVVAVGGNTYGQCNVSEWSDIVAIDAGAFNTIGLKADGTVVAVGTNDSFQCNVNRWKDIKIPG